MKYDAVVIGAGLGGLGCAARLARAGRRVLALEAEPHTGGTSHAFTRSGFGFPMGPLSFSHPRRVRSFLRSIGAGEGIRFRRNHFQVAGPGVDLILSQPFRRLGEELRAAFPDETGIDGLMHDMESLTARAARALDRGGKPGRPPRRSALSSWTAEAAAAPCASWLRERINNPLLINLIGSMSLDPPGMSRLNLAVMWNLMARVGIWTPDAGVQTLGERMTASFRGAGGEMRTGAKISKILVGAEGVEGVRTEEGETFRSRRVISNADYKTTFLDLIDPGRLPGSFREAVEEVPYSGSELCVYLGVDPARVDWSRMRAVHLLYQRRVLDPSRNADPLDFSSRQIEICRWSSNAPGLTPAGKASLVLRVGLPYHEFAPYRTGFRARRPDYRAFKNTLADALIRTAEGILPGLDAAVEVKEAATPLTYADWGRRRLGSIAGWTWGAKRRAELEGPLLVKTPIPGLMCVGIYAASDLFLGGVPTALHTAEAAASLILKDPASS